MGLPLGDGSWQLRLLVTDLQVERTIRVLGDDHIGGVMIKLVDILDIAMDWSDPAHPQLIFILATYLVVPAHQLDHPELDLLQRLPAWLQPANTRLALPTSQHNSIPAAGTRCISRFRPTRRLAFWS